MTFWQKFKSRPQSFYALMIFLFLCAFSGTAEFFFNDKPLVVWTSKKVYFPVFFYYPETDFFPGEDIAPDYKTSEFEAFVEKEKAFVLWPFSRYGAYSVHPDMDLQVPSPPSKENWLGTDEQGRDLLARLVYGLRISLLFGIGLACGASILGLLLGAFQGYWGGTTDLIVQRLTEIWSGLPIFFLLMIVSSFAHPGIFSLIGVMAIFSWPTIAQLVRAEFLRGRQQPYVQAAEALGVSHLSIAVKHILPNAIATTLSYLPFLVSGAITSLTFLDFLGIGLPLGMPSIGEILNQAKSNLHAPWIGISALCLLALILILITFIGEGLREAFDPKRT